MQTIVSGRTIMSAEPETNEAFKMTIGLALVLGILILLAANLFLRPRNKKPPK